MSRALVAALALGMATCAAPRSVLGESPPGAEVSPAPEPSTAARNQVRAFVAAVKAQRFDAARALLDAHWRAEYSAARLAQDYAFEPAAAGRIERLAEAVAVGRWVPTDGGARLARLDGGGPQLVEEAGVWRLRSLEE